MLTRLISAGEMVSLKSRRLMSMTLYDRTSAIPESENKSIGEIGPFPLIELARNPIDLDITDASVNLDKYIYTRVLPIP